MGHKIPTDGVAVDSIDDALRLDRGLAADLAARLNALSVLGYGSGSIDGEKVFIVLTNQPCSLSTVPIRKLLAAGVPVETTSEGLRAFHNGHPLPIKLLTRLTPNPECKNPAIICIDEGKWIVVDSTAVV